MPRTGSSWWRRCVCYLAVLGVTYFLASAEDSVTGARQLALCGEQSKNPRSLIFVSTLDGKISALDASNHGQKQWTLDFNDGPMLSSSIHRRELNNNGQWVRLIPSLNGGLYKFDGEFLETIPISSDQLLHSSFRYSDDLVFSGGKELHSYGVSASTGAILYKCGVSGCKNDTSHEEHLEQDVLIVQRFQQTVRAVEARTGVEKWNFSVGQHDLVLIPATDVYCPNKITNLDIDIKVIIPEGLVWATNRNNPDVKLWQYKFDSPIVAIWREDMSKVSMNQTSMEPINLFDDSQWHWGMNHPKNGPNLYLGMHDRQLYVQESNDLKNLLNALPRGTKHVRYPWHPHPAVATALIRTPSDKDKGNNVSMEANETQSTTALSVLYNSDYINGNGFYLYSKEQLSENSQCNGTTPKIQLITGTEKSMLTYVDEERPNSFIRVVIGFVWYWWPEFALIAITSFILWHYVLCQRLLNATAIVKNAVLTRMVMEKIKEAEVKVNDSMNVLSDISKTPNPNNFDSRYLADFEPVDCLGKGGYGVVFEAKNKIDDCNYAIKRIALPNSRDSRERVMREVKALAKLDHQNIVRYFNAWLECPPKGWQEQHDQQWMAKLHSSEFLSEVTRITTKPNDSVCIDVSQTDQSSVSNEAPELHRMQATSSDSCIVFEKSTSSRRDDDAVCISNCGTDSSDVFSSNASERELINITDHSESIVFQKSNSGEDHNDDDNHDDDADNAAETKGRRRKRRQTSLSLDLTNKSSSRRSPKMFLYIQMQLCQRLSLREWLKQHTAARDPSWVFNIFQQIVDAVEYVHLQGLIHRDLKPSNIFFAFDDKVKIGDFGLVTAMTESYDDGSCIPAAEDERVAFNDKHTAYVGTHLYMSPEQTNGKVYSYKVDIYSLGIIFFELLTPFSTDMERITELLNLKRSVFPKDFAKNYPDEYDLLKMMLDQDPTKRPTTLGIKAKPPLQNYEAANDLNAEKDSKWHFELPQTARQSSASSSSTNSTSSNNE